MCQKVVNYLSCGLIDLRVAFMERIIWILNEI